MLMVIFSMLPTLIFMIMIVVVITKVAEKSNNTNGKISTNNTVRGKYKHKGCFTEGEVVHPEKVGNLKNKNKNPFEI